MEQNTRFLLYSVGGDFSESPRSRLSAIARRSATSDGKSGKRGSTFSSPAPAGTYERKCKLFAIYWRHVVLQSVVSIFPASVAFPFSPHRSPPRCNKEAASNRCRIPCILLHGRRPDGIGGDHRTPNPDPGGECPTFLDNYFAPVVDGFSAFSHRSSVMIAKAVP